MVSILHKHISRTVGGGGEIIRVINDPSKRGYYDAGKDCGTVVRKVAEKTMASTGCYVFDEYGNKVLERNRK